LGIAANLIKRRQVEMTMRAQREPHIRDLYTSDEDRLTDDELFSRLAGINVTESTENLEAHAMLSLVSEGDRVVLRLAMLYGFNGDALAQELDIKPGAARVRLHRALNRLRDAWHKEQRGEGDA
jgi:DNA-directed RNA polymerase specialized sigma24 family protein